MILKLYMISVKKSTRTFLALGVVKNNCVIGVGVIQL